MLDIICLFNTRIWQLNFDYLLKDLHDFTLYQKNLKKLIAGQSLPPRDTPSIVTQILQKLYKK
jgi:hypothetical protein